MKEYTVVLECKLLEFEDRVTKLMNEGWIPIGGVQILEDAGTTRRTYFQSMIKTDKNPM